MLVLLSALPNSGSGVLPLAGAPGNRGGWVHAQCVPDYESYCHLLGRGRGQHRRRTVEYERTLGSYSAPGLLLPPGVRSCGRSEEAARVRAGFQGGKSTVGDSVITCSVMRWWWAGERAPTGANGMGSIDAVHGDGGGTRPVMIESIGLTGARCGRYNVPSRT